MSIAQQYHRRVYKQPGEKEFDLHGLQLRSLYQETSQTDHYLRFPMEIFWIFIVWCFLPIHAKTSDFFTIYLILLPFSIQRRLMPRLWIYNIMCLYSMIYWFSSQLLIFYKSMFLLGKFNLQPRVISWYWQCLRSTIRSIDGAEKRRRLISFFHKLLLEIMLFLFS